MSEIVLSICVAIYNIKEQFLKECIESVIYDKSEDIEIILGDDCSDNGCGKICESYAAKDKRIKYIRLKENSGVSVLRNTMIKNARGKIITFVDGDDVIRYDYAEKLRCAAESGFDIVMFSIKQFYSDLPKVTDGEDGVTELPVSAAKRFSAACLTGKPPHIEEYNMKDTTPSSVCIKAYKRSFLEENGLEFEKGVKKSQDTVFNTKAFYCCKKLGYIDAVLYFYRTNPSSVCNRYSANFEKMMNACFLCDKENLEKLYNNDPKIKDALYKYKTILIIIDNFRLNIFHKDNPHSKKERKAEFLRFIKSEPYKDFFENCDFSSYEWRERKLILTLAKKEKFSLLDFMYKNPVTFKIYGGVTHRLLKLVKRGEN